MKKRTKIILTALVTTVIGGSIYMINEKDSFNNLFGRKLDLRTTKEKQLDYLKEHQEEIIDFVKSQNPKIESVQIDWDQTRWEQVGNGTPQGGGEVISVFGEFNHLEESDWNVLISLKNSNGGKISFDYMMLSNGLRLGDGFLE